jgi:serine/threonine protein phosphatase PrpC
MTEDGCIESIALDNLAIVSAAAGRAGQDQGGGMVLDEGYLLIVADGAGGISGGTIAAERVVDGVWKSRPSSVKD